MYKNLFLVAYFSRSPSLSSPMSSSSIALMASTMVGLTGLSKLRSLLATDKDQAGATTRTAGAISGSTFPVCGTPTVLRCSFVCWLKSSSLFRSLFCLLQRKPIPKQPFSTRCCPGVSYNINHSILYNVQPAKQHTRASRLAAQTVEPEAKHSQQVLSLNRQPAKKARNQSPCKTL